MPSYSAIGKLVGMTSKASVAEMVGRMKRDGFLESAPDRRLRPGPHFHDRPLAAHVRAGKPNITDTLPLETLNLDDYLVRDRREVVLVTVKGDSMVDAGILQGDIVVVERRSDARSGQIVVALLDGEFTLKRLKYERGAPVLLAENKAYPAIRPSGDFRIFGVIVGLARSYR